MTARFQADYALVRDVLASKAGAWETFVQRVGQKIWAICRLLVADESDAQKAFGDVLEGIRAGDFRRLRAYTGASRVDVFVSLVARDILASRLVQLFVPEPGPDAWPAFQAFFKSDIDRVVARRLPGTHMKELREDATQTIALKLIDDNYRRIRAYTGAGSFPGFILHTVDRLTIDFIRQAVSARRQSEAGAPKNKFVHIDDVDPEFDGPSPEQSLVDAQDVELSSRAIEVLKLASKELSVPEQLYVQVILDHSAVLAAREVAKIMKRPVEEIYKLRQRVLLRLRELIERNPDVKNWRASV